MTSIAAAQPRTATTTLGTVTGSMTGSDSAPGTNFKVALGVGGVVAGGLVGALIGARSGHAIRGASIGAGLVGLTGLLAGCAVDKPLIGTVRGNVRGEQADGVEEYQGTCTQSSTTVATNSDGTQVSYETTTEYPCTKTRTHYTPYNWDYDGLGLTSEKLKSFGSLDALLGAKDFGSRWDGGKTSAITREGDKVVLGDPQAVRSDVHHWYVDTIKLDSPDAIAVVSQNKGKGEQYVTFGPGATEADKAAINARLGR